ncbi:tetraacyldisaccharide 4'-kinase [Chlorobium sp. N1]|uniref:tetraacyldisaccharide 4'-kinase n=1 Tax=Chlorobium sp. N1 TaxID=2491138 RepID=UPI001038EFC2|nr:tetraacyldisaccharide 4'-kinase [Chlorobium sp. N1]TCD48780.1 tetraacyldisaccharide 4'-kinase [Chlorobium sp. N1]
MHENPLSILLRPAALLYGLVASVRNRLFDDGILKTWHSPIPVVSVGNLTAGGTGKTPLVDWVVKYYLSIGCRPAVVSRGYGRRTKGVRLVSDGQRILLSSRDSGDETAMLATGNPEAVVVVAERRSRGVQFIMEHFKAERPDVIILDDAFQHRQIERDLDIVVINSREPFSGARMLPEGRLREPLEGVGRADAAVISKITDEGKADAIEAALEGRIGTIARSRVAIGGLRPFGPAAGGTPPPDPAEVEALAFAGIASPSSFVESLMKKGVHVREQRFFADHEAYTEKNFLPLVEEARQKGLWLMTTEKDRCRLEGEPALLAQTAGVPCCSLEISTGFTRGEERLRGMLKAVVRE